MSLVRLVNFIEKNKISDVEKHVARIIVDAAEGIVTKQVKDIAYKAHTTHSTISKFIKKAGFNSWSDFITSVLFEEKVKAQNYAHTIANKTNLEIENVELFLRTKAHKLVEKIIDVFLNQEYTFIFYGKRLTGNVAQYIAWNFTGNGLAGSHTYFLDELWGMMNQHSVLVAFCLEKINDDFLKAISRCRTRGAKVISVVIGKDARVAAISHLSLQIPPMGYFQKDKYWNIIQNEILRYVGLRWFEMWHQKTRVPKN